MPYSYQFNCQFLPVGQGLFSAGGVSRDKGKRRFLWVYDCGTASSNKLIEKALDCLAVSEGKGSRITLLALSHFDHDHISGVCLLLSRFHVGTLILPYMTLAQRLIIAFEEGSGGVDHPMTDFYLNPVAYLSERAGPGIDRILFVPASGDEGPLPPEGAVPDSEGPILDGDPELEYDTDPDVSEAEFEGKGLAVEFLRHGSSIDVPEFHWEFVPYNDDPTEAIPREFLDEVALSRDSLLSSASIDDRKTELLRLRKLYDDHFGDSAKDRNIISLFLYSGPVYPGLLHPVPFLHVHHCRGSFWHPRIFEAKHLDHGKLLIGYETDRCGILYTGDGYLDTSVRLRRMINYLSLMRIRRTCVFQVMHHGSDANWHHSVASVITPLFSVFSSDPAHKKFRHPHANVLRDFFPYGAVQVDKQHGFGIWGALGSPVKTSSSP